jgi:hypothetical protein
MNSSIWDVINEPEWNAMIQKAEEGFTLPD